jgi:epsilon-lactone hydrolase
MPSKQSEAVRRRWEASWLAMTQPDGEGPDDESWGDLTAEPREVDYLEIEAGGRPAASHVAFAGDSTGGWLAVIVQLRARGQGLPLPAAAMLLSPAVDMEVNGESFHANRDKDPFFHRELVRGLIRGFLGGAADPRDPLVNPLHADLTGLGPVYIQVGGDETLLDDARLLGEHASKAGVDVRLDVFPGMLHTFQMAAGRAPEADDAIRRMADWVRPKLGL